MLETIFRYFDIPQLLYLMGSDPISFLIYHFMLGIWGTWWWNATGLDEICPKEAWSQAGLGWIGWDVMSFNLEASFFVQTDGEKMHDVIFLDLFLQGSNQATPKMVSVFGSCEAEEKKKIIEIGIIQPLTGEIELHFRQVTTQIWDTEMLYNPIIVRTNLPTFREFGPIFDTGSGKSAECLNCSSTFHGYIAVKLKAILL